MEKLLFVWLKDRDLQQSFGWDQDLFRLFKKKSKVLWGSFENWRYCPHLHGSLRDSSPIDSPWSSLGGNWSSPTKFMVAVLDTDSSAKPVQIIEISIKNIKEKFYSIEDFTASLEDEVFSWLLTNCNTNFLISSPSLNQAKWGFMPF
jgi:hypothetical protein